jgi:L-aspartate semialdehyde sulfurtransferase ferredoxin
MKLLVTFSRKKGRKPIIAQVVRDTGVLINVERAVIDSSEGEALIEVPDDQCKLVSDTMVSLGANVRILDHGISVNESECVDCGACISICPREVFSFDTGFALKVDEDRCVLCGRCVDACPHRALSLAL